MMRRISPYKTRRYWAVPLIALSCLILDSTSQARLKEKEAHTRNPATPQRRPLGTIETGKITEVYDIEGTPITPCYWGEEPTLVIVTEHPNDVPDFLRTFSGGRAIVFPVAHGAINESLRKELSEMKKRVHGIAIKIAEPRQASHSSILALHPRNTDFWIRVSNARGEIQEFRGRDHYYQQLESAKRSVPVPNRCPASK